MLQVRVAEPQRHDADPQTRDAIAILSGARAFLRDAEPYQGQLVNLGLLAGYFAELRQTAVLGRAGATADAMAAHARSVSLEPDNWRHTFRFSYSGWGEERLAMSRRALGRMPGLAMARWIAATVYVARGVLGEAEREVDAGRAALAVEHGSPRFAAIGLHWLKGLLLVARGAEDEALEAFQGELALEGSGHMYVYVREMAANTWSAVGACHLGRGDRVDARAAFEQSLARVPAHPMSSAGLAIINRCDLEFPSGPLVSFDHAVAHAAVLVARGEVPSAVEMVRRAVAAAPADAAGWRVPIDPLLQVQRNPEPWASVLAMLSSRAM